MGHYVEDYHIDHSGLINEVKGLRRKLEDYRRYWTYREKYDIKVILHYFDSMLGEMEEYNDSFLEEFLRGTITRFDRILKAIETENRDVINA